MPVNKDLSKNFLGRKKLEENMYIFELTSEDFFHVCNYYPFKI